MGEFEMKSTGLRKLGRLVLFSSVLATSTGCDGDDTAGSILDTIWLALQITEIWV